MIRYISKEERDMAQSILIVDDERDIVSMLNQYFCKIGYVVYTAINGKEALNAITKHPDIILLVSAKYCYAAHESRLHQNDRCKRFTLCLVLTVRFRSLAPWGKLFQLFI